MSTPTPLATPGARVACSCGKLKWGLAVSPRLRLLAGVSRSTNPQGKCLTGTISALLQAVLRALGRHPHMGRLQNPLEFPRVRATCRLACPHQRTSCFGAGKNQRHQKRIRRMRVGPAKARRRNQRMSLSWNSGTGPVAEDHPPAPLGHSGSQRADRQPHSLAAQSTQRPLPSWPRARWPRERTRGGRAKDKTICCLLILHDVWI